MWFVKIGGGAEVDDEELHEKERKETDFTLTGKRSCSLFESKT